MRKIIQGFWLLVLCIPFLAQAAPVEGFKEGKDYHLLKSPVQTSVSDDRIEVAEVFWYGCPHCSSLEKVVTRWKPQMTDEAQLVRVPGFFGPNLWQTHAQLYYTLESLFPDEKSLKPVHDAIFQQVQERNNLLKNEEEMLGYLTKHHKVDKDKFLSLYNSFGVKNLMNQASSKVRGYQLTGVPVLVIDGRFVVEPKVGLERMPEIADYLIERVSKERAEAKAKKSPTSPQSAKDQNAKVK
ncbi:thiol:disulfide interchange protein DsbA/DsbL [Endozoicomonas montiporae]|uniref:Thiol:disulfide interchange protein DsbA n=1 Tax=Endozoicomonas montiporae CL-33 TaxID=570277 RepID=A0A142B6H8_9GAMM|nr:thiol:disulfide interchange protein DsbA/DsbL [Endozoicomonas montiporae]AMO54354.1 disulfide bond formation protein A [Endozoicomonas montiporae CL-33]